MNQPSSSCYTTLWADEIGLTTANNLTEDANVFCSPEEVEGLGGQYDDDIKMVSSVDDDSVPPVDDDDPPTSNSPHQSEPEQIGPGRFIETNGGCAEMFPGGET